MKIRTSLSGASVPTRLHGGIRRRNLELAASAAALVGIVVIAFIPVLGNPFVDWDDTQNFLQNPHYRGLGWAQVWWAWTGVRIGVYQPVSWMLLEVQYAIWQLNPWGYHFVSVVLHALNAGLLLLLLLELIRRSVPAAYAARPRQCLASCWLAAASFAVHPLRTEVVAWASCQPYLPCAFFFMLAAWCYLKAFPPDGTRRPTWFWLAFACFVASLLSKAVAVTLPFVLLILDGYPLRRLKPGPGGTSLAGLCLEKRAHFAASAVFMGIALAAKPHAAVVTSSASEHLLRVSQAAYGIWFYAVKTIVPVNITALYGAPVATFPLELPFVVSLVGTVVVTGLAIRLRRRIPALLAAWASYVVILAPNLGVVKVTTQIAADRYSYVALIGPTALVAGLLLTGMDWAWRRRGRALQVVASGLALLAVAVLIDLSRQQALTWRSTEALWRHALAHGGADVLAVHNNLAMALLREGRLSEARDHLQRVVRLSPNSAGAHNNFAVLLDREGRFGEAERHFREAIRLDASSDEPHANLGALLVRRGDIRQGIAEYVAAIGLNAESTAVGRLEDVLLVARSQIGPRLAPLVQAVVERPGDATGVRALREALELEVTKP